MKRHYRIFAVLLSLFLFVILAAACGDSPTTSEDTREQSDSQSAGTTAPDTTPEPALPTLTLNGVDLSEYTLVYATHPYGSQTQNLFTEYDFYQQIAEHIAEEITEQFGVELPIVQDAQAEESAYEILVGPTNRSESDIFDKMNVYQCTVVQNGTRLVVGGGYNSTALTGNLKASYCYASTYHAWDFVKEYVANEAKTNSRVNLADGFTLEKTCDLKTVACIGDSITEGDGSSDWSLNAYPAALQRLLWQDCLVLNYGCCGRTMRDDLGNRYKGTAQYAAAVRYAKNFDLALIMLGTNDSGMDTVWTSEDDASFYDSALGLAERLTRSNEDLKLIIMSCPAYYGNGNSGSAHVRNLQADLISRLTDAGYDTEYYNMHKFTAEELGSQRFPDGLHPDNQGYYRMAEGLAEAIPSMLDGTWECEPEYDEAGVIHELPQIDPPAGSVNLMKKDLKQLYPMESGQYANWWREGGLYVDAPYIFMENPFENTTVTHIEVPVSRCKKGDTFTVSVVKYQHPTITETLKTYTLTAEYDGNLGWAAFTDLQIEVPEGYTLAFGAPSDSIELLYIGTYIDGYGFYGSGRQSINTAATLAFCVYGKRT